MNSGLAALPMILLSVLASSTAHLWMKMGVRSLSGISRPLDLLWAAMFQPYVIAGGVLYAVSLGLWLLALARAPLSFAYPFIALGFVMTTLAARFLLGESLSPLRLAGIAVICIGVLLVALSARH